MYTQFLVQRDKIQNGKFVTSPTLPLVHDQQILIEIHQVAFTTNNVTYAVSGERLGYWQFFPTQEENWGIIPVWGFGRVIASQHPEIPQGERIYGYFPMASHVVLSPDNVHAYGFVDAAPHRRALSPIYNSYIRTDKSAGYEEALEAINALLRPMFTTSFLLDDFFFDNQMFQAKNILLSSASSKTAYGTAFLLHTQRQERPAYNIIGLTSAKNVPFVKSLGLYDSVLTYEEVTVLNPHETAAYMDFSGNQALRKTIHDHFHENLVYDAAIGFTDWEHGGSAKGLAGAKAQFFFAPSQLEKRLIDWGATGYRQRMTSAWLDFIKTAQNWLDITELKNPSEIAALYQAMVWNQASPEKGYILSL